MSNRLVLKFVAIMTSAALMAPVPASAQFGGLFKKKSSKTEKAASDDCETDGRKSIGKSILGNVLRDFTGRATRSMGQVGRYVPRSEVAGTLTDSIACRLDPDEQTQAAQATIKATEAERAGTTVEWKSRTRKNVSGRSTVNDKTELANGTNCMNVTDIVIVEGEETRVSKRMCKGRGESRYRIANA